MDNLPDHPPPETQLYKTCRSRFFRGNTPNHSSLLWPMPAVVAGRATSNFIRFSQGAGYHSVGHGLGNSFCVSTSQIQDLERFMPPALFEQAKEVSCIWLFSCSAKSCQIQDLTDHLSGQSRNGQRIKEAIASSPVDELVGRRWRPNATPAMPLFNDILVQAREWLARSYPCPWFYQ